MPGQFTKKTTALRIRPWAVAAGSVAFLACSPAIAQSTSDDDAEVSLTPYLWMAGAEGNIGAVINRPPIPVDADFAGIFDSLSGAFMGSVDARYGRFGVLGDAVYLKVSGDRNRQVGTVAAVGGEIESQVFESTLAAYWRVHGGDRFAVDLLAGARYQKTELEVDLSLNDRQVSGSADRDWLDPVVGVRGIAQLSPRFSLTGYADYGGFGVSSDSLWQVYAAVNYRFTDHVAGSVAYRYYSTEFSDGDFDYNVDIAGPLIGLTFIF